MPKILAIASFLWRHWRLVVSFFSFPKLPDNWEDSEQVRLFMVALLRSETAHELTQLTVTRVDDDLRLILATLASNATIWKIAWEFANNIDKDGGEKKGTIRDWIRTRIAGLFGQTSAMNKHVERVEDLVTAIKATKMAFGGK